MPRSIALVIHPGFQLMDAAGPVAAFEIAGRFAPGSYDIHLIAPGGGDIESSAGLKMKAAPLNGAAFDTLMLAGGEISRSKTGMEKILAWLRTVEARRIASVCSGAYFLAEAGLLEGARRPRIGRARMISRGAIRVKLDAERIFVRDDNIWTSAGISAGIDLALALIEDDLGPAVARRVAQQLVVHQRRPGGQLQFSALVELGGRSGRFAGLIDWMRIHLNEPLTIEKLADHAAMSPRNFARVFAAETGMTPAKAVERLRLEVARAAVEASHSTLDRIAEDTGFGDASRMRRAFLRSFGQPPQVLRRARVVDEQATQRS